MQVSQSDLLEVLITGLATCYLLRAWLVGSIFATPRSFIEDGQLVKFIPYTWAAEKLEMLLQCALCLAPYAAFATLAVLQLAVFGYLQAAVIIKAFAAATVALLLYPLMDRK